MYTLRKTFMTDDIVRAALLVKARDEATANAVVVVDDDDAVEAARANATAGSRYLPPPPPPPPAAAAAAAAAVDAPVAPLVDTALALTRALATGDIGAAVDSTATTNESERSL